MGGARILPRSTPEQYSLPPPTIALAHVATTPLVRDPHKRIRKYRSHTHTQYETVNGTNRSGQRVEEGWFGESKLLNWEQ